MPNRMPSATLISFTAAPRFPRFFGGLYFLIEVDLGIHVGQHGALRLVQVIRHGVDDRVHFQQQVVLGLDDALVVGDAFQRVFFPDAQQEQFVWGVHRVFFARYHAVRRVWPRVR